MRITLDREHTNRSFGNNKHRRPYQLTLPNGETITKWYYSDEQASGHLILLCCNKGLDYRHARVEALNEY